MQEKLFKWLFPKKANEMELLEQEVEILMSHVCPIEPLLPMDFSNVNDEGKPPHYLAGLTDKARKNFISNMESIYSSEQFKTVINYVINVIANHSFQKEPDESKMRNGRYGVVAIRMLMAEFERVHSEFLDSRKKVDDFDPLSIMPD